MNNSTFKVGDVVRLKSGGPTMTIKGFTWNRTTDDYYTNKVDCTWFDDKELKDASFDIIQLELD
jgi:uncharacterized protein YodC (DUF2158 family)